MKRPFHTIKLRRTPFGPARWTHVSVFSSGWMWVEWAAQFSHCLLSRMALELLEGGGLVWPKCRESLLDVNGPRGCFISYNDRENNKITPTGKCCSLCRSSIRISICQLAQFQFQLNILAAYRTLDEPICSSYWRRGDKSRAGVLFVRPCKLLVECLVLCGLPE